MTGNVLKRAAVNRVLLSPERRLAVLLVAQGYAIPFVAAKTNLTVGAVQYWSRILGVKTTDYRNGRTQFAAQQVKNTKAASMNILQTKLKSMQQPKQIK